MFGRHPPPYQKNKCKLSPNIMSLKDYLIKTFKVDSNENMGIIIIKILQVSLKKKKKYFFRLTKIQLINFSFKRRNNFLVKKLSNNQNLIIDIWVHLVFLLSK